MITFREARWPQDISLLSTLDTEFTTDRGYRLFHDQFSFHMEEDVVSPALQKKSDFDPSNEAEREIWHFTTIAEEDGPLAGFAAAEHERWNNRINIRHIYVMPVFRRRGVGTLLMSQLEGFARSVNARSLWLETQNTNYPAIQFYLKSGFRFCGFDAGLYDPKAISHEEVALFFERPAPFEEKKQP